MMDPLLDLGGLAARRGGPVAGAGTRRRWMAGAMVGSVGLLGVLLTARPASAQLRPQDDRFWAVAAIAVLGSAAADQQLADALRGPGPPVLRSTADLAEPLGRARVGLLGLGASYAAARLARQPAWVRATLHVAAGFVAASGTTGAMKPIVDRARPMAGLGPYAFHDARAGEHHHSFPSGHATQAFALAAGIAEEANRPWVTAVTYGGATLVAWSRVHDQAHWTSDVIAGAVVGTSASLTTIHWLERREARHEHPGAHAGTSRSVRLRVSPETITLSMQF